VLQVVLLQVLYACSLCTFHIVTCLNCLVSGMLLGFRHSCCGSMDEFAQYVLAQGWEGIVTCRRWQVQTLLLAFDDGSVTSLPACLMLLTTPIRSRNALCSTSPP
jgi:hypothetical protein